MMVKTGSNSAHDPNLPVHVRNYEGFLTLLKYTVIVTALITAIVIYIISN